MDQQPGRPPVRPATPALNRRRHIEVSAKLRSLDVELRHWESLTEKEDLGLRRHYTQVRRLAAILDGLTETVRKDVNKLGEGGTTALEKGVSAENGILAAHSIWDIFRTKLLLREDAMFSDVLAACDDLGWECYGPAMQRFAPNRKEPPLVYFTATWSPFMTPRDANFHNEIRAGSGTTGALRDEAFLEVLKRLPIPLISVPWHHVFHLPGAIVIAHEVGHVVETDFDLTGEIVAALSRASLNDQRTWISWAAEVFADLYGCLCMGPAFVGAMMDLLATTVSFVQGETRSGGKYPTRALRIELMLEALAQTGHANEAARLRATWEEAYGPMQTMLAFKPDVQKVVAAILAGPYKGAALPDVIRFPTDSAVAVATIGEAAAAGSRDTLKSYPEPRLLFAGAQWLHENPQRDQDANAYTLIVDQITKKAKNQFRRRGAPVAQKAVVDADLTALQDLDRQSGRELRTLLGGAAEPDADDDT